jgi:hypothetical protein
MFMMSVFEVSKGVLKKLDHFRSRFFWQGSNNKNKYKLARWTSYVAPKIRVALAFEIYSYKTNACWLSG